jgi:hypothetical protein
MRSIICLFLFIPVVAFAQLSKKDSLWLPFKYFIGEWKGTGDGVDGTATYERSYKLVLNNNYIEVRNKSNYAPTEKNYNGYSHEDVGFISYDKIRKVFIFRQFHIEGFVNEYRLDSISPDKKTLVFISESIENIPAGWRARETFTIGNSSLKEAFDLAEPGKEYRPYTNASLVKQ